MVFERKHNLKIKQKCKMSAPKEDSCTIQRLGEVQISKFLGEMLSTIKFSKHLGTLHR